MRALVVRLLVNGVALWVATLVVGGVSLEAGSTAGKIGTLLVVAAIFGLVNAIIKPVVKVLAFPLYLLTLGLLTFVVNALLFWLTAWISGRTGLDYRVDGFWSALLGALVVSLVSFALNALLRDDRRRDRRGDGRGEGWRRDWREG
jgi:putative membrane protein